MADPTHLSAIEAEAARKVLDLLRALSPEQAQRVLANVHNEMDARHDDRPAFARGISGPLGKLDIPVKTKLDEHTHTLWLQRLRLLNKDNAVVLRDFIYYDVHGRTWSRMVMEKLNHEAQCAEATAKLLGPIGGPEFGGHHG